MSETLTPPPEASAMPNPADCAQELKQLFPALFVGPPKPVKLRIQLDIQQRAPGRFSKQALSAFFRRHTGSTSYLIAVSKAPHRFDLDGQASGEVSAEHRQAALDELERRRANRRAREDLEEQQRRNRATLLRDFQSTTLTPANFCALKGVALEDLDGLLAMARSEAEARAREPAPQRFNAAPERPRPSAAPERPRREEPPRGPRDHRPPRAARR